MGKEQAIEGGQCVDRKKVARSQVLRGRHDVASGDVCVVLKLDA